MAKISIVIKNDSEETLSSIARVFNEDTIRSMTAEERLAADMKILAEDIYGWTEEVSNPDFDSSQPISESNPEKIENPINIYQAASFAIGKLCEQVIVSGIKKREIEKARILIEQAASQSVDSTSVLIEA